MPNTTQTHPASVAGAERTVPFQEKNVKVTFEGWKVDLFTTKTGNLRITVDNPHNELIEASGGEPDSLDLFVSPAMELSTNPLAFIPSIVVPTPPPPQPSLEQVFRIAEARIEGMDDSEFWHVNPRQILEILAAFRGLLSEEGTTTEQDGLLLGIGVRTRG